jgi:hypothetical protein
MSIRPFLFMKGEAPVALLLEGATRAPLIAELVNFLGLAQYRQIEEEILKG